MRNFDKKKILTISAAHLFHDIYPAFFAPMLPLLMAKFGLSLSAAGFLDAARRIPSVLMPLIGYLADRKSMKHMLVATPGVTALSMSLLGVAPSYFVLFVLLFIAGLSSVCFHIPSPVLIKFLSGDKVGKGMSYYMTAGAVAATIGTLITSAFIAYFDIEHTYALMIFGLAASFVLHFQLKNISTTDMADKHFEKNSTDQSLRGLIPFFVGLGGYLLFRSGMTFSLTLFLPVYLTEHGVSPWFAGISLSALQLSGACGMMLVGRISDKIPHRRILFVLTLFSTLIMWVFISLKFEMIHIAPLLVVLGALLFASAPVVLAEVQKTRSKRPALVNSIYMTLSFAINTSMVVLVGFAGDHLGLETTFKICATLPLAGLPFILLLANPKNLSNSPKTSPHA
jgi:FSR family fosmidomycin resistance protein-like MFS transporter